jgi:ATP-dependent protease HslVU (ClpYQ) peptidase subunit
MTTIVAMQGASYAAIGTDSRISSFDEGGLAYQITTLGAGSSKIGYNGKYILGAAGDVRAINILHHAFTPPTPSPSIKGKKLDAFITNKFIPALRECFELQGYAMPERDSSEHLAEHGSTILVAIHGTIYVIEGDYSWTSDSSGIYALGTGAPYALGALAVLAKNNQLTQANAKKAILHSLQVASKFDPYTGPPFSTMIQER